MEQGTKEAVEYISVIKSFEISGLGTSVEPKVLMVINKQTIESIYLVTDSNIRWFGV